MFILTNVASAKSYLSWTLKLNPTLLVAIVTQLVSRLLEVTTLYY